MNDTPPSVEGCPQSQSYTMAMQAVDNSALDSHSHEEAYSNLYTDLHLCDEGIDEIPARYLAPCPGIYSPHIVVRLDLSRNAFADLRGISVFVNLVSLDVSNNGLTQLPEDIAFCSQLRALSARNNLIEELPKTMSHLNKLETLNLSGNRFLTFPEVILTMHSLRVLYLGANGIDHLPYNINCLSRLSVLYLGGNALREVPATIGSLQYLVNLTLCDNQLETIPATVAELQNLECLSLHNNHIRTLPTEIVKLRNLQQLSLRNNPLVHTFVHTMSFDPPALKELAGRTVRRNHALRRLPNVIPNELIKYLESASQCVNPKCKGVYFEACIEHVKFVDFCGKYRVPLLQFLCSGKCAKRASSTSFSESSSDEDEPSTSSSVSVSDCDRMRKVLLG